MPLHAITVTLAFDARTQKLRFKIIEISTHKANETNHCIAVMKFRINFKIINSII